MSHTNPHYEALELIERFYGRKKAQRSRVPLINHIHEGCAIIDSLCLISYVRSEDELNIIKAAFCLHPIIQPKVHDPRTWRAMVKGMNPRAVKLAVQYSRAANAYLCCPENDWVCTVADIKAKVQPFMEIDVDILLIADKIQNRKDFLRHHSKRHPRRKQLYQYFNLWLEYLRGL